MRDELGQSFALLPRPSEPRMWVATPRESGIKEVLCRRSRPAGALSIEGPTKNKLCRTISVSSHPPEPMVDEAGFPDTGPSNDCNDVYLPAHPRGLQKSDILIAAKNIASCNGQSGY